MSDKPTNNWNMLYTAAYTTVHVLVYLFLYCLPRGLWIVCVRWPTDAISRLFGVRVLYRDSAEERQVRVLGPAGPGPAASKCAVRDQFGIQERALDNPALHHEPSAAPPASWTRYEGPLYNGHLHTILGAFRPPPPLRSPEREVVPSYDSNPTCLDWWLPTPPETAAAAAATRRALSMRVRALVVILPGLTGSSKEFYVRRMARQLLHANLAVCVLNARGVADTPLEQPQIFSALFTKDVRHIMAHHLTPQKVRARLTERMLSTEKPDAETPLPIFGVAFSLGGLILTNYVAEQGVAGEPSGFDAVYTITSPHHVSAGAAALRSPLTNFIYGPSLFRGLRRYYERHKNVVQQLPGVNKTLFAGARPLIDRLTAVQAFDEHITGPHFGFAGAEAYYTHANNFNRFHSSHTPQLCLVAANDPICGPPQPTQLWMSAIDRHPAGLVYVEMPVGGHLGFVGSPLREWMQTENEMERFILFSLLHFIDALGGEETAASVVPKIKME